MMFQTNRVRRASAIRFVLVALAAIAAGSAAPASAQSLATTAFTYQGVLKDGSVLTNGAYDLQFKLFNSLGVQVGATVSANDVAVVDGRFSVALDFLDQFSGQALFLEIAVRPGASVGAYTTLTPRQELTGAPYAQGIQLPLNQTGNVGGPMVNLTNTSTSNIAPVMRLTSGAPSGNAAGVGFQGVLVLDTNDGNGLISYNSADFAYAIYARTEGTSGATIVADNVAGAGRCGWFRIANAANTSAALEATTTGTGGTGISASATAGGTALRASNGGSNTAGYAGDFNGRVRVQGDVQIIGSISKGSGTFKIDHPLDPENKFLYHSFVESPEMKNIYDGVVSLDVNGNATVRLPEYFEALNRDFRYQLTCIGGFAPVFIAKEVSDNQFQIAGGSPGLKVSWTVTGIRKDPYANANRVVPEVMKSQEERGLYLYPEAYGKPPSCGLNQPPLAPGADTRDRNALESTGR